MMHRYLGMRRLKKGVQLTDGLMSAHFVSSLTELPGPRRKRGSIVTVVVHAEGCLGDVRSSSRACISYPLRIVSTSVSSAQWIDVVAVVVVVPGAGEAYFRIRRLRGRTQAGGPDQSDTEHGTARALGTSTPAAQHMQCSGVLSPSPERKNVVPSVVGVKGSGVGRTALRRSASCYRTLMNVFDYC